MDIIDIVDYLKDLEKQIALGAVQQSLICTALFKITTGMSLV